MEWDDWRLKGLSEYASSCEPQLLSECVLVIFQLMISAWPHMKYYESRKILLYLLSGDDGDNEDDNDVNHYDSSSLFWFPRMYLLISIDYCDTLMFFIGYRNGYWAWYCNISKQGRIAFRYSVTDYLSHNFLSLFETLLLCCTGN